MQQCGTDWYDYRKPPRLFCLSLFFLQYFVRFKFFLSSPRRKSIGKRNRQCHSIILPFHHEKQRFLVVFKLIKTYPLPLHILKAQAQAQRSTIHVNHEINSSILRLSYSNLVYDLFRFTTKNYRISAQNTRKFEFQGFDATLPLFIKPLGRPWCLF